MKDKTLPRGIRNNNPLNIRIGNRWRGEVDCPTDKEFEQFKSMAWGLRAAFVLLHRYMCRYGLRTITDIISRWAPSNENNTRNYIHTVAEKTGIGSLDEFHFFEREKMFSLVAAMAEVECGQPISREDIEKGYALAMCTMD